MTRHYHRPKVRTESVTADGVTWTFWDCECGEHMLPRNATGRQAPTLTVTRMSLPEGTVPAHRHALGQVSCRWGCAV